MHAITGHFWVMFGRDARRGATEPSVLPRMEDVLDVLEAGVKDALAVMPYAFTLPIHERLCNDLECTVRLILHLTKLTGLLCG